jgi:CubicO group peptidase (beta-lactamase class C family)
MIEHPKTEHVLEAALQRGAFTAVTAEVGRRATSLWTYGAGRLDNDPGAAEATPATIFDLASLTKVLATTSIGLSLVSRGLLDLELPVASIVESWTGHDRAAVTVRDLFEHSSGLPAHRPFFRTMAGRDSYQAAIACAPLEFAPRTQSVYSDLGFILLGFILEDVGGALLDVQFREWRAASRDHASAGASASPAVPTPEPLDYRPPSEWTPRIASTGLDDWRSRTLRGEVHDGNAAALGGVAAHAGLFGTAAAVGEIARWWLARLAGDPDPPTGVNGPDAQMFARRSTVRGSSRAVGWDTMLPTSSCGSRMSPRALGHTGFTGTSLWIDPTHDLYVVLLSNHVCVGRDTEKIRQVRRAFHDAVLEDWAIG